MHTGRWVREAANATDPVIVMDRGRPTARLLPIASEPVSEFSERRLVPGFEALPEIDFDSGKMLEEDRR